MKKSAFDQGNARGLCIKARECGYIGRLAKTLLCLMVACTHLGAATAPVADPFVGQLDQLVTGIPLAPAELERAVSRAQLVHRALLLAVGLEIGAEPAERIARLSPLYQNRREAAAAQPAAVCSLADAFALAGDRDRAEQTLDLLDAKRLSDLDRVDVGSVRVRLGAVRQVDEAQALLEKTRSALKQVVPEVAYETWRSHLIRRRLDQIGEAIEQRDVLARVGPAYWAWLLADRRRSTQSYQQIRQDLPGTIFADAAIIELARLKLRDDPRTCVRMLTGDDHLARGPLAIPALMLQGDALLVLRDVDKAQRVYGQALPLLNQVATLPAEVTPAMRAALVPPQPLHAKDEWNCPIWRTRSPGCVLAPGLDSGVASYLRYQLIVRLAALAFATGDKPTAVALARSLSTFDDVDRSMAVSRDGGDGITVAEFVAGGAGGDIMASVIEGGYFNFPLEPFLELPLDQRAGPLLAVAFYNVYDFAQAREWAERAAIAIPAARRLARISAQTLVACSSRSLRELPLALTQAQAVTLKPDEVPHRAWFVARLIENGVYQSDPARHADLIALWQAVRERAPGTEYAQEGLFSQAYCSMAIDPKAAKRYFLEYRRLYPEASPEFVTNNLAEIDAQLKGIKP